MKMERILARISDTLPVIGGATGAVSQAPKFTSFLPTWETIIGTIILTIIGAVVGYLVKLYLDKIFKCKEQK